MSALQRKISKANRLPGRSKPSTSTNSNWQKVVFIDEEERPCVDLIVEVCKFNSDRRLGQHGPGPRIFKTVPELRLIRTASHECE